MVKGKLVKGNGDKAVDFLVYGLLFIVALVCVVPLLIVFSMSFTPMEEVLKNGGYVIIPKAFTLNAYKEIFKLGTLTKAMGVTVFITVAGTIVNLILTTLLAYPLSNKHLPGRTAVLMMIVFTMFFQGGLIPTYLVVKDIGLINSLWAMVIPNAIWTFNVLVMKSFFENLPVELFESARIDGANEFLILFRIVIPLSLPVMMTVGLFYMVGHWNEFYNAILYVRAADKQPLQVVLRSILMQSANMENVDVTVPTDTLKMASVIFASLPIIIVYPFVQKYFVKGMLLGAVKG